MIKLKLIKRDKQDIGTEIYFDLTDNEYYSFGYFQNHGYGNESEFDTGYYNNSGIGYYIWDGNDVFNV